jgi:hypothetical protein
VGDILGLDLDAVVPMPISAAERAAHRRRMT